MHLKKMKNNRKYNHNLALAKLGSALAWLKQIWIELCGIATLSLYTKIQLYR